MRESPPNVTEGQEICRGSWKPAVAELEDSQLAVRGWLYSCRLNASLPMAGPVDAFTHLRIGPCLT
jgi:hypothetical protein